MKRATLLGGGLTGNRIFDLSSPANRDNCFEPYAAMRAAFLAKGIELNTADLNAGEPLAFELHQDARQGSGTAPAYLMLFETSVVRPGNAGEDAFAAYRKVFTWNDALVDGQRFIKINFPNPLVVPEVDGFASRPLLCCLIAGNKSVPKPDARELYGERVRAIRWFEKHAPADFGLYGIDWDLPPARPGLVGKILDRLARRVWRMLSRLTGFRPFPSYRGKVERKRDVLQRARFSICYENVRDIPGYITEKIFDCFFSGCVPVYWGADNITRYIPADCFIDRRQFADTAAVYDRLRSMGEDEYRGYQRRIAAFLAGEGARPFGSGAFAETIVNTIVEDLGRAP